MVKPGDIVIINIPPTGTNNICDTSADGAIGVVTLRENESSVFIKYDFASTNARRYNHKEGDIFVPESWLRKLGEVQHG